MGIDLFRRVMGVNQNLITKDISFWEEKDKKEASRIISFKDTE